MKFKDWTHEDFELCDECIGNSSGVEAHHAILFDDKDGLTYFEIFFNDFQVDYSYNGYYPVDLEYFQNNDNPIITIIRPIIKIDEDDGSEYFDSKECIFKGKLKSAQADERFANLEIEENVRSDYMRYSWATNSEYEKHFSKYKNFNHIYDNYLEIMVAIKSNNLEEVKNIVKKDIFVINDSSNEYLPLERAAKYNNIEIVKFLLENGADVNASGDYNWRALGQAIHNENLEMVKLLIEHGADINKASGLFSSLGEAVAIGNLEIVKYLIDKGAVVNTNIFSDDGLPGRRRNDNDKNEVANSEILKMLVRYGADVNSKDINHLTPLEKACDYARGNKKIVETFIELGANITDCAFIYATNYGHLAVMETFVNNGYKIKSDILSSADFILLYRCYPKNLEFLLENGVDVNVKNKISVTPLMIASKESNFKSVKLLIEHGADVNAVDENGRTALDYANMEYEFEKKLLASSKLKLEEITKICDLLKSKGAIETQQEDTKSNTRRQR